MALWAGSCLNNRGWDRTAGKSRSLNPQRVSYVEQRPLILLNVPNVGVPELEIVL
jgi:hypothetical protein